MTDLTDIRALDAADPLAHFRDRFDLPEGVIYLDGNSLGALPREAKKRIADVVSREWGQDLIRSWNTNHWIEAPRRVGSKIAQLIGAKAAEVIATDSTSINVFKALSAAIDLNPDRPLILSETGNFPTDAYMMEGLSRLTGGRVEQKLVAPTDIPSALTEDVAVLLLTHTNYKSGRLHDMAALTKAAQAKGILVIWDLSHSAGAMPVDLNGCNVDFAVGCGYKYMNGGPGAPAFVFVAERHQNQVFPALSGWMGHANPFDFTDDYEPAAGIDRFLCGTPGILGLAGLECGVDLMLEADMAVIRNKSLALSQLFIDLVEANCPDVNLVSPRTPELRGSQISFAHERGYSVMQALIARGIIGDFRAPNVLRFGFTPLYTRFEDVWIAAMALSDIIRTGEWENEKYALRAAVT
ncbi:MAG: kynureninase [Maricaulis sp.]|nr:kynureninase [Maricaulis sp.]